AVVNIYAQSTVRQSVSPLFDDPFFRQFFGGALPEQPMLRQRIENALGSGVIVRPDGLIVTARHVIAGADKIRVVLADRREFSARVVLSDEHADLAVLKLDAKGQTFPYLQIKDSDATQVGDLVLAIGDPFGVGQTVTMGIVSAFAHKAVGAGDYDYFIQTDAAINPGNSGGALVTMDGGLVGINASIYSRDGGNMGIGFAVPSDLVRAVVDAAEAGKTGVIHPWTGIDGQEMTQDIATSIGLAQPTGFLVKRVDAASPAARAGLRAGDVIASVNGYPVDDVETFRYRIGILPVGATATFGIIRDGKAVNLPVELIAPPENTPRDESVIGGDNPLAGAKIANLSPAVMEELNLHQGGDMDESMRGVVVVAVADNSPAAATGLQPGDIVASIGGRKIAAVADALAALKQPAHSWRFTIMRGGNRINMMMSD
ncbi:MAG: Do family serine endopeptidase, partial [Alphaproteobacteria bacterium]|nr:Do family serine endopeptidase [Alphaproteobacteria bacterium]